MKRILCGAVLLGIAVGIAACVKQVWRVTYPGPGDYSAAYALAVADDGVSYIAGFLSPGELFVASYDANGAMKWDREIEANQAGNNLSVGKMLALSARQPLLW